MDSITFDITTPAGALDAIWHLAKQYRGLTREEWAAYDKAYSVVQSSITETAEN